MPFQTIQGTYHVAVVVGGHHGEEPLGNLLRSSILFQVELKGFVALQIVGVKVVDLRISWGVVLECEIL